MTFTRLSGFFKNRTMRKKAAALCAITMLSAGTLSGCTNGTTGETTPTVIDIGNETTAASETAAELKEDTNSEITALFDVYFSSLLSKDIQSLGKIMVNAPDAQAVEEEVQYTEDYQNIKCYSMKGQIEGTYVVYVYYDVKFKNIDTLVPSLIREYVCTNEDGTLYINNGMVDGEIGTWLDEVQNSDYVQKLVSEVNAKMKEAAESDAKLAALIAGLDVEENPSEEETSAEAESSSAEETTGAPEASTAEETTTAAETTLAPETTTAAETTVAPETTTAAETTKAPETSTTAETTKAPETTTAAETTKAPETTTATETTKAPETTTVAETTKTEVSYDAYEEAKTLYAQEASNIRKSASADSEKLGKLSAGDKVTALGTTGEWTVIKYQGGEAYVKTELLGKNKVVTFTSVNEKVVATQNVRMRKTPSTDGEFIGKLAGGTEVVRTGYNSEWSRIKYDGKTVYVATKYLSVVH